MLLGIEIGGTKLQLGIGRGDGSPLVALDRLDVEPAAGAAGIRRQLETAVPRLIARHAIRAIGIGFGGPVDTDSGRTLKSHQIEGWDDFPLARWCRETFGVPTAISNDSDSAGLAEARFGAGQGSRVVFYTNAGSGVGGALVLDGRVYRGGSGVAAELGHLRPGLEAVRPDQTVEAAASGWGIVATARAKLAAASRSDPAAADLLQRCRGDSALLTGGLIAAAAAEGNPLAREAFQHAVATFGWAIAQMITLLSPQTVVVGGGVSLAGETIFLGPLREAVERYVFPPSRGTYKIVLAQLGEAVVVHGALAIALEASCVGQAPRT